MLYHLNNPHGGDIYAEPVRLDFSANINPFGTPEGVIRAAQESLQEIRHYPDPYCRRLTERIAAFEGVPQDLILCGSGAAELIYAFCEAEKPLRAVELAPTFSEYSLGLQRFGCEVSRFLLRQEEDFAVSPALLEFLQAQQPQAVFLCTPNNPTGRLTDPALLRQVLDWCRANGALLFLDECFLDLTDEGESMKPCLQAYPQLVLLKAFTKSYGMAGLRLGYCLSTNTAVLQRMSAAVQPWNVSTPAQAAGIAALEEQQFLRDAKAVIRQERPWLRSKLEALGFYVCPSQVNFLLFHGPENLHRALRRRQIAIRSCDNYVSLGPGWYRIAVRTHPENKELIRAIAQCLKEG